MLPAALNDNNNDNAVDDTTTTPKHFSAVFGDGSKLMSIISKQKQQIEEMQLKLVLGTGCKPAPLEVDIAVPPTVATVVSSNKSKDRGYYLAKKYNVILADDDLAEIMLMHGEFHLVVFLLTRRYITQFGFVL